MEVGVFVCFLFQGHVLDYPGIGKVLGVVGSGGIQGCAFCELSGQRNEVLYKTLYMENLPTSSTLRGDTVRYNKLLEIHYTTACNFVQFS